MKKETIYIKQKVVIEYDNEKCRKLAIKSLLDEPGVQGIMSSAGFRWKKDNENIRITRQRRKPITP